MIVFLIIVIAGWAIYLTIPEYAWLGQIFNMGGTFGAVMCYQITKERIKRLEKIEQKRNTTMLRYKNYTAEIKYSDADGVFYGKIKQVKDLVVFESISIKKIKKEFRKAVKDYIHLKKIIERPEKFNLYTFGKVCKK